MQVAGPRGARVKPVLPQVAAAAMQVTDVWGVVPVRAAQRPCQPLCLRGHHDQMDMVAHQAVAQHAHLRRSAFCGKRVQVDASIHVPPKKVLTA